MSNFMKKNFYKQREYFEKSAAVRDKKFSFPDGVVESRDIPYIADGQKEPLFLCQIMSFRLCCIQR